MSIFCKITEIAKKRDPAEAVFKPSVRNTPAIWSHSDFLNDKKPCHGQYNCMKTGSSRIAWAFILKRLCRVRNIPIHLVRYLKTKGVAGTMKLALFRTLSYVGKKEQVQATSLSQEDEVLNLQPGELVEVKSFREIAKTFDKNQRCKGLYFMGEMRQFCGRQFRVFKRVNRILLESTGEIRKVKNTILLGDVVCDGHVWYDCDRSCFYYWREAWLKRVEEKSE